MDNIFIDMESFVTHLKYLPRAFPGGLPLNTIGIYKDKDHKVDFKFSSWNFSFILKGTGHYVIRDIKYRVEAPCVITQWPDEPMDYGPDIFWDETYLIFPYEAGDELQSKKLFDIERPIWNFTMADAVSRQLNGLYAELNKESLNPDRIDRIAERLVMESLIAVDNPSEGVNERFIRDAGAQIQRRFTEYIDYDELAESYGISPATFRRYWRKYIGGAPGQYQADLVMREACRLLVETIDPINTIAEKLNFDDPLYFSRKFHKLIGQSPTEYRRQNQPFKR